jgi:hypothetical protein
MLKRIFGSNRAEITGGWWKLHNKEFHNLYSSPRIIKYQSKEYDTNGTHSTHRRDEKCIQNFSQKSKGKYLLGDLGIDRSTILKINRA